MAHAQGAGTCVVGRRIEGIGETWFGWHTLGISLEDLARKIATVVLDQVAKTKQRG